MMLNSVVADVPAVPQTGTCGTIRILVADEYPVIRKGVAAILNQHPDYQVCGEADRVPEVIRLVQELRPQLVLLDLTLNNGSGLELIKDLAISNPQLRLCVFSMHDELLFAERCLRAGAHGFVSKNCGIQELLAAIRTVVTDRIYLSEQMTSRILSRALGNSHEERERSPIESLSDRELQVFEQVGRGVTTRQIAERLLLSPKTVETYRENIKIKLRLRNAAELTQHAVKWVLEKGGALASV